MNCFYLRSIKDLEVCFKIQILLRRTKAIEHGIKESMALFEVIILWYVRRSEELLLFIADKSKRFFFISSPQFPDRLWCPPSVPAAVSPGVKRPGDEADRTPPFSAEVTNEWRYTSTPTCLYGVYRGDFTFGLCSSGMLGGVSSSVTTLRKNLSAPFSRRQVHRGGSLKSRQLYLFGRTRVATICRRRCCCYCYDVYYTTVCF